MNVTIVIASTLLYKIIKLLEKQLTLMQLKHFLFSCLSLLVLFSCKQNPSEFSTKTATSNGYTYEYVTNDKSNTRIYTLENGLKVYLSDYKDEPRIQTCIPVKAGGKFDPETSTGLAHYLEHMMFKGNNHFGTKDWEAEKIFIDSIENMFEHYRTLTDAQERKDYYLKIDQVSNEASKLAIANEYDKMVGFIGATGTNAYTTEDRTVYINNIPSNQLENWLDLEAKRFNMIVNRLFHTELEAVYEEKNRSLDNDGWKSFETMYREMFKEHKYGTQTVIGTIEHLKNPSIKDIREYFNKYYIPNNIAICLSGDLDYDKTIALIDKYFGQLESQPLEAYSSTIEPPITSPREATVIGPDAENVNIGFRFGGSSSEDIHYVRMVDMLLNNSTAGLIDLNLVQKQQVLRAGSYVNDMNDYSIHTFFGNPREGQTLEEVRDLILEQIEKVKKGEFDDWLMNAVVNDFKKSRMRSLESNWSRANDMVMAFTNEMPWAEYISNIQKMEAIDKEALMAFANEHYKDNYVIVYKRTGEDPNKMEVEKPSITKVDLDRTSRSDFFNTIASREIDEIKPVFINYKEDLKTLTMKADIPVLYKENTENDLFTLYYLLETGTNDNAKIKLALDYLKYLGSGSKSAEDLKKEFYKLGCDFNVSASEERTYVTLSGIQSSFNEALVLFEELLSNPQPNEEALANLKSDSHKSRSDDKKNKNRILWGGLMNYAKYGAESPFTNVLSNEALNAITSDELLRIIKGIPAMEHTVMYYGPTSEDALVSVLNEKHLVPDVLQPLPPQKDYAVLDTEDPQVFWTNYDMVQAEIVMQSRGPKYDPEIAPEAQMFNEYFGGMSGVVFQEIREAQGLAYSVFSSYSTGAKKDKNDVMMAYIGTQADKQEEAMNALIDLMNNIPESEQNFENAKKAILKKIESDRITKTSVFFNYLSARDRGLDYDIREKIYDRVQDMKFDDVKNFHQKYIKDKKYNIAVLGNREKLNFAALDKYGAVQELTLDEIFGYKEHVQKILN
jgi:predicted Zn-dependent peptidase